MNILGGSAFSSGFGAIAGTRILSGNFANNITSPLSQGIPSFTGLQDKISFSPGLAEGYAGFNNPLLGAGNSISALGMGPVPGFGGAMNPIGSMFGGLMQQMKSQEQMMMMMMMMLLLMQQQQRQNGFSQGPLGSMGSFPGGGAPAGIPGFAPPPSGMPGSQGVSGPAGTAGVNPLSGDDAKTAQFIDQWLAKKKSPAASQQTGAQMVQQGKQNGVDPLILLAIAGHETGYGKLGVGVNGMLGVGAYDSDPNNSTRNPKFSGVSKQVGVGARTFKNLRAKGGSSERDPIEKQLMAVNQAGWATDKRWHAGVLRHYNEIVNAARTFNR